MDAKDLEVVLTLAEASAGHRDLEGFLGGVFEAIHASLDVALVGLCFDDGRGPRLIQSRWASENELRTRYREVLQEQIHFLDHPPGSTLVATRDIPEPGRYDLATTQLVWRPNGIREAIGRYVEDDGTRGLLVLLDEDGRAERGEHLRRILDRFATTFGRSLAHYARLERVRGAAIDPALCDACGLTDREREVAAAVARGLENKEIARELGIALQTVKNHLKNAFRRTEAANRTDLVRRLARR